MAKRKKIYVFSKERFANYFYFLRGHIIPPFGDWEISIYCVLRWAETYVTKMAPYSSEHSFPSCLFPPVFCRTDVFCPPFFKSIDDMELIKLKLRLSTIYNKYKETIHIFSPKWEYGKEHFSVSLRNLKRKRSGYFSLSRKEFLRL